MMRAKAQLFLLVALTVAGLVSLAACGGGSSGNGGGGGGGGGTRLLHRTDLRFIRQPPACLWAGRPTLRATCLAVRLRPLRGR